MTNLTFVYGGKTLPVIEKDGNYFADFNGKIKPLKMVDGKLTKAFAGREPGSTNGNGSTPSKSKTGNAAPDSGLWAKVRAKVAKNLSVELENVGIIVTGKTVTINADEPIFSPRTNKTSVSSLCTWSANLADWLAGNAGTMSPANSVQDSDTLAAIGGTATMLNDWHK